MPLPAPVLTRLCSLYQFLTDLTPREEERVSSAELSQIIGVPSHTIRKDLSTAGIEASSPKGYSISGLKKAIEESLGLGQEKRVCVAGLGRLGTALLLYPQFLGTGYAVSAGFDASSNRLETLSTPTPLYPAHEIPEIVARLHIELGIIAVPPEAAQKTADRFIEGGIQGIINFAPVHLVTGSIPVRNISVVRELHILSSLIQGEADV